MFKLEKANNAERFFIAFTVFLVLFLTACDNSGGSDDSVYKGWIGESLILPGGSIEGTEDGETVEVFLAGGEEPYGSKIWDGSDFVIEESPAPLMTKENFVNYFEQEFFYEGLIESASASPDFQVVLSLEGEGKGIYREREDDSSYDWVFWVYVTDNVRVAGSKTFEENENVTLDINLKKGWNSVVLNETIEAGESGDTLNVSFADGPGPADAGWYSWYN